MTVLTKKYKNPRLTQIGCEAGLGHTWSSGDLCRKCALPRCTRITTKGDRCTAALYKERCPYHGVAK